MAGGRKSAATTRDRSRHNKARANPRKGSHSESGNEEELDLESLNVLMKKNGLYIRDVTADGNCLFRAVSDQLYGNEKNHFELRAKATRYMSLHPGAFKPFIDTSTQSFEDYVLQMASPNTWGDNLVLQALSKAITLDIRIHQLGIAYDIRNDHGSKVRSTTAIHLSYHDGQHYASVRRIDLDETDGANGAANHPLLSIPTPRQSAKSSQPEAQQESGFLVEAQARARTVDKDVEKTLENVVKNLRNGDDERCCGNDAEDDESGASRPRVSRKFLSALQGEAADIRELTLEAVKRATRIDILLRTANDEDHDHKSVARSKKKVYQMLDIADVRSKDLEELARGKVDENSKKKDDSTPAKRPSKKKAQQAKVRERKARRLREQEHAASADIPLSPEEPQSKREVAI
jgi:hypothetical protein